ncbi:MAG: DMT family transporter [Catenulispora sp.]|nr:DMT family transporter [Catenulispora sp.]
MSAETQQSASEATAAGPAPIALRAHLQLLVTVTLWGSGFVVSKRAVDDVPHSVAALVRFGSAAVILLAGLPLFLRSRARLRRAEIRPLLIAGLLGTFAYNALLFFGLSRAPAIDGTIIIPVLSPVLTTAAALLLGWEKADRLRTVGLAAGAAGAVLFLWGVTGQPGFDSRRLAGEVAYVLATAAWSAYTLVGKKILKDVEPFKATAYSMAFGAVFLAVLAVPDLGKVAWSGLHGSFYGTMTYLVLAPTVVAYGLFYVGVRAVGPTTASVMMFIVPVSGTILSRVLLHESVSAWQAAGSVAMLGGAVLATVGPALRAARSRP